MSWPGDGRRLLLVGLRGLRARWLLSVGSIVLIAVSVAGAVLGPMYQSASTASYIVTRLQDAPNLNTGVTLRHRAAPNETPTQALHRAARIGDEQLAATFAPPQLTLLSDRVAWQQNPTLKNLQAQARILAKQGACQHLVIVDGHCPATPTQTMALVADLRTAHLHLGDAVDLPGLAHPLTIVGSYRVPAEQQDYWFDDQRLATVPAQSTGAGGITPYRPAPFVVTRPVFATAQQPLQWAAYADRRLVVTASTTIADLDRAAAAVTRVERTFGPTGRLLPGNSLPALARQAEQRAETARATVIPAVVSLILVALVLLARLVAAATDQRSSELALASLRGMSGRQLWVLGLLEPVLMIAIAAPIGVVGGYLSALWLARVWLVPGLPVSMLLGSWVGVAAVLLVALGVTAVVVRATLAESLSTQIAGAHRPRRTTRWTLLLRLVVVAAAVAVLAASLTAGGRSTPSATDLALPILVAVGAGLVMSTGVAVVARWWSRRSVRRRGIAAYLAARTISRRRQGVLVILPLTAALAIAVFAAGVYGAAADWRASNAATMVGADRSYPTQLSMTKAVALTHRLDPDGQWLMAAAFDNDGGNGQKLIVDTPRLQRVSVWPSSWTPQLSVSEVADRLSADRPAVAFTGTELTLSVRNQLHTSSADLTVSVLVHTAHGADKTVILGPFPGGEHTRTASVRFCADGCVVQQVQLSGPAGLPEEMRGTVAITRFAAGGAPVPGALNRGWREIKDPVLYGPLAVVDGPTADGALHVRLNSHSRQTIVALTPTDVPASIPVLLGRTASPTVNATPGHHVVLESSFTHHLLVHPIGTAESLPIVGPKGMMVDFRMFSRATDINNSDSFVYVLAREDTPESVLHALAAHGIGHYTSLDSVHHELNQGAYALALNLYLVVAGVVILLALCGLATNLAVQTPARRRDAASLRVIGVRRLAIVRAVFAEFCAVLGAAALAGIGAGLLAQYVVVRTVTLGYADSVRTPRLLPSLDVPAVLSLVGGVVVVLLVVAVWVAGRTVGRARTSTLRESTR